MGVVLGLVAALCWGSADMFVRTATRRIGTFRALLYGQFVGFVLLGAYLLGSGELARLLATIPGETWFWAAVTGLLNLLSAAALYRSFQVCLAMALVSPIAATYAAITVIFAIIAGETLTTERGAGILLALVGVALTAADLRGGAVRPAGQGPLSGGVGWAMLAALAYGLTFWLLGFRVAPALGGFAATWMIRATSVVVLALVALAMRFEVGRPDSATVRLILAISLLDTAAYVATAVGQSTDQVSVVTVLGSLFTAVTVVLSWVFLRERLQRVQWVGIGLIFVSIVLVSV